jgi:hypothetical protein
MNDNQRLLLFFLGCIPVRIIYAIFQNSKYSLWWLNVIIGVYFIYSWATWKGEKGAFGGILWWNNMRLIHGIIYLIAIQYPYLLYIDVIIGIIAKLNNFYKK